jgi:hypothetical protein
VTQAGARTVGVARRRLLVHRLNAEAFARYGRFRVRQGPDAPPSTAERPGEHRDIAAIGVAMAGGSA